MKNPFKTEISRRRALLRRQNKSFAVDKFVPLPQEQVASDGIKNRIAAFRSRDVLVQVFSEKEGIIRLSINRTDIKKNGQWEDGLTWDSLQYIKDALGFQECDAFEIYPRRDDIVDVANIRHLWVLPPGTILPQGWRNTPPETSTESPTNGTESEPTQPSPGTPVDNDQKNIGGATEPVEAPGNIVPLPAAHNAS